MARFNRSRLIEQLSNLAEQVKTSNGFTDRTGTAQMRRRPNDTSLDDMIQKAVEYGRWMQLRDIAESLRNGEAGK